MLSEVRWSVSSKTEPETKLWGLISQPVKSPLSLSLCSATRPLCSLFCLFWHIRLDIPVRSTHSGRYFELQNEKLLMFAAGATVSLDRKWYLKIKQKNPYCNICTLCFQFSSKADGAGSFLKHLQLQSVQWKPTTTAGTMSVWQSQ